MIELKFANIVFAKDDEKKMSPYDRAKTAVFVCPECGCEILNSDKPAMLRAGEWKAVKKRGIGRPKSLGYWINSLYSIFVTWADVAEEYLKSKDDPELLQNFVNSWLAEAWEDTKLKTSSDMVLERQTELPKLIVPSWAKMLTAGVMCRKQVCIIQSALLGYILPARISHMDRYWIFQELKGSWMENLKQKMGAIWLSAWP